MADVTDRLRTEVKMEGAEQYKGHLSGIAGRFEMASRAADDFQTRTAGTLRMAQSLQRVGGAMIAAGAGMVAMMGAFVKASMKAEEEGNLVREVFAQFTGEIIDWSIEFGNATNRSARELRRFAGSFQDTLVPMGVSRDLATQMSKRFTQLGIDMASFYNEAEPEMMEKLNRGLVGFYRSVANYGVIINETILQQELLNMGLNKTADEATTAEKAMARLNLIERMTRDAMGDATKTAGSLTNRMKGLESQITELKIGFGQQLNPTVKIGVALLTDLLKRINELPDATKATIVTIVGSSGLSVAIVGMGVALVGTAIASVVAAGSAMAYAGALMTEATAADAAAVAQGRLAVARGTAAVAGLASGIAGGAAAAGIGVSIAGAAGLGSVVIGTLIAALTGPLIAAAIKEAKEKMEEVKALQEEMEAAQDRAERMAVDAGRLDLAKIWEGMGLITDEALRGQEREYLESLTEEFNELDEAARRGTAGLDMQTKAWRLLEEQTERATKAQKKYYDDLKDSQKEAMDRLSGRTEIAAARVELLKAMGVKGDPLNMARQASALERFASGAGHMRMAMGGQGLSMAERQRMYASGIRQQAGAYGALNEGRKEQKITIKGDATDMFRWDTVWQQARTGNYFRASTGAEGFVSPSR